MHRRIPAHTGAGRQRGPPLPAIRGRPAPSRRPRGQAVRVSGLGIPMPANRPQCPTRQAPGPAGDRVPTTPEARRSAPRCCPTVTLRSPRRPAPCSFARPPARWQGPRALRRRPASIVQLPRGCGIGWPRVPSAPGRPGPTGAFVTKARRWLRRAGRAAAVACGSLHLRRRHHYCRSRHLSPPLRHCRRTTAGTAPATPTRTPAVAGPLRPNGDNRSVPRSRKLGPSGGPPAGHLRLARAVQVGTFRVGVRFGGPRSDATRKTIFEAVRVSVARCTRL
jgi:hypothetical protein